MVKQEPVPHHEGERHTSVMNRLFHSVSLDEVAGVPILAI